MPKDWRVFSRAKSAPIVNWTFNSSHSQYKDAITVCNKIETDQRLETMLAWKDFATKSGT